METIIYLLKSASILTLFYIVYILVLRKDTFFSANRHYLIAGIIASITLPFLIFKNTIYIDPPTTNNLINYSNITQVESIIASEANSFDWMLLITTIYIIGILIMSIRLLRQLVSLYFLVSKNPNFKKDGYKFIKVNENITPFSFFKYIVYNPKKHTDKELEMILKHEQIHAIQFHSLDVVISNLLLIMQWINPFAWLYKKSIEENLEFIADSETVQQISKKDYQLTLLKTISTSNLQPIVANNFYHSLIKKRIIMLHKNQSSNQKQWKLLIILPLLGVFLWSFNVEDEIKYNDYTTPTNLVESYSSKAIIDNDISKISIVEKSIPKSTTPIKENKIVIDNKITVTIDKNTTNEELEKVKKMFKDTYNVTINFSDIERNSKGEITAIKVDMKSEKSNANFNQNDSNGIHEIIISYDHKKGSINIGNFKSKNIHFKSKEGNAFVYEIEEDSNGNVNTWVSKDGKKIKHKKGHFIIHEDHDGDNEEHEIKIISGDDSKATIWVTDGEDEKVIKKGSKTIIIETDEDHEGEDMLFINSDSNDEDSIFVVKKSENSIFLPGGKDKNPLIYIDGKKSTSKKMEKLKGNSIEKIEVIKGDKAIEKYGEKAKDGVILITTKKN